MKQTLRKLPDTNESKIIPAASVMDLCGNISQMTLWRWLDNPKSNFPKPIYISRRRYWKEAEIVAWLDSRPMESPFTDDAGAA